MSESVRNITTVFRGKSIPTESLLLNGLTIALFLVLFLGYDQYFVSSVGVSLGVRAIFLLVINFEKHIPVFEILIALTYVQLIISAFITYRFDIEITSEKFEMSVPELEYMNFVVPALILTEIILRWPSRSYQIQQQAFTVFKGQVKYQNIGLVLFLGSILISPLEGWVPPSLRFIFFLLGILKYIGFFYLWTSGHKYRVAILVVLIAFMTVTTLQKSIFINYLVWLIYIFSIVLHRVRVPFWLKLTSIGLASSVLLVVQVAKMEYREAVWFDEKQEGGALTFLRIAATVSQQEGFRELATYRMVSRLNQGYILAKAMEHNRVERVPDPSAQFRAEFLGVLMPRFLFPQKIEVNTGEKITDFTGWRMTGSYTMSVGVHGDGYGNFGYWGGLAFVAFFFLFTRGVFNLLHRLGRIFPSLILWIPYLFFYSIRPGSEFYIITNWIVKSAVILILVFIIFQPLVFQPIEQKRVNTQHA
jgi:hypothetical protein